MTAMTAKRNKICYYFTLAHSHWTLKVTTSFILETHEDIPREFKDTTVL